MHLMQTNVKITAIVLSVFIYTSYASDRNVVKSVVDHTVGKSTTHHQSNRPPENSASNNGWSQQQQEQQQQSSSFSSHQKPTQSQSSSSSSSSSSNSGSGGGHASEKTKSSYAMLSQAMSEAVHHEFSSLPGSGSMASVTAEGSSCLVDDFDCINHDQLGMEAIKNLHRQLDDDEDGDIDLAESDDFLREELKYESGYEKRHKAFHHNDDLHISVKELWEAWLRSEVHNWTVDQTTEWLAQSVQLPQYVRLFRQHKVTGRVLPLLAVNNMHYVSNVLGIKDPIHKQKIALKAMDAVLFGPPRETGTRWKDLLLVALLLTAIIGSWYAYQQNKNAKFHLRRMAKDMEGLHNAEIALQEMQKELERARLEQENVGKEKLDLERRLKEAPSLKSSDSDLEVQQLRQEIATLRSELLRAEGELIDQCYSPPPGLQIWLQLTYELESRYHTKKRILAEKQLQQAREACEKLKRKRSSLYGAFVSTHGKSIDDVDRSIVEARNSLSEVTNELQERTHRWKQIEQLLGFSIINNNGIAYLENVLYNKSGKSLSRGRISNSQDDLDDDSVQAFSIDGHVARGFKRSGSGVIDNTDNNSSTGSDETDRDSITFVIGSNPTLTQQMSTSSSSTTGSNSAQGIGQSSSINDSCDQLSQPQPPPAPVLPRSKKLPLHSSTQPLFSTTTIATSTLSGSNSGRTMAMQPRRILSQQSLSYGREMATRSQSTDLVALEPYSSATNTPSPSTNTIPPIVTIQPPSIPIQIGNNSSVNITTNGGQQSAVVTTAIVGGLGTIRAGTRSNNDSPTFNDAQLEDTSTDSSSIGGDTGDGQLNGKNATTPNTIRKRKLHFPFTKKSNKSKIT